MHPDLKVASTDGFMINLTGVGRRDLLFGRKSWVPGGYWCLHCKSGMFEESGKHACHGGAHSPEPCEPLNHACHRPLSLMQTLVRLCLPFMGASSAKAWPKLNAR